MKKAGANIHLVASLDDVAWLLNMRGNDIDFFPLVLAYVIVREDSADLYVEEKKLNDDLHKMLKENNVNVHPYNDIYEDAKKVDASATALIDPMKMNYALYKNLPCKVVQGANPTILMKAIKNETEIKNVRNAELKDSVALTKFIYWLKNNYDKMKITELSASEKLTQLRSEQEGYVRDSFEPLHAFGAHAATSHVMAWTFYEILRQKQNKKAFPEDEKRLYEYIQTLDPVGVLEFARHLNTVFITYGSYRFDWLQQWALEKFKFNHKVHPLPVPNAKAEEERLKKNADFLWQKRLWQELIEQTGAESEGKIFGWLENTIERIRKNKPVENSLPVHLFLPFSIPPNLLPLIRAYEDSPAELNLYILNPCAEYWFESVPKAQFDWSENLKVDNS